MSKVTIEVSELLRDAESLVLGLDRGDVVCIEGDDGHRMHMSATELAEAVKNCNGDPGLLKESLAL